MTERVAFAAELKRARESRGLTLEAIAAQTKVSATHFAGLERADLSRWPPGIFRRAFVRNYALAVGLDPEETVARCSRLFPDPGGDSKRSPAPSAKDRRQEPPAQPALVATEADPDAPGSRLALEQSRSAPSPGIVSIARRLLAGLVDISLAVLPAVVVARVAGAHWFWPVAISVAIAGHLACSASVGATPGAWLAARLAAPPAVVSARVGRRRAATEASSAARRRVPRHAVTRPAQHVHRVRH